MESYFRYLWDHAHSRHLWSSSGLSLSGLLLFYLRIRLSLFKINRRNDLGFIEYVTVIAGKDYESTLWIEKRVL